jgi:hypothetical protein
VFLFCPFPIPRHDITEILLKVALNTITHPLIHRHMRNRFAILAVLRADSIGSRSTKFHYNNEVACQRSNSDIVFSFFKTFIVHIVIIKMTKE